MQKMHYDYAILRLVPHVDREEFFNVGVILFCRKTDELMTKIVLSEEKLRVLGPDIDVEDVRRGLLAIVEVCGDRGKFGSVPLMSRRQRFDWLVAPKSALIQTSAVHSGFSIGLKETLDHLCARYLNLEQGLG